MFRSVRVPAVVGLLWATIPLVIASVTGIGCATPTPGNESDHVHQVVWVDSSGRTIRVVPQSDANYAGLWLSRDERSAVADILRSDRSHALWRIDLTTGASQPVAEPGRSTVLPSGGRLTHWSEQFMVFDRLDGAGADTGRDIAAGADAQRAVPFLRTPWIERDGQLSAEGQWMAYVSEESGLAEVYVQTYPDTALGRWLVSLADGGQRPAWRADSLMIYYWAPGARLMQVPLKRGRKLVQPGRPELMLTAGAEAPYAVTGDGLRILMAVPRTNVRP